MDVGPSGWDSMIAGIVCAAVIRGSWARTEQRLQMWNVIVCCQIAQIWDGERPNSII